MGKVFRTYWEQSLPGGRWHMHKPGDKATVTGEVLERLERIGAVRDTATNSATEKNVAPDAKSGSAPKEPSGDDSDPVGDAPKRPKKIAKLEVWQNYARAVGVDPRDLSKEQLIARIGDR